MECSKCIHKYELCHYDFVCPYKEEEIYPIKYASVDCPNCNRRRVEEYNNGELICEKCNWNVTKKEYNI